jgi:hypothetical protein
MATTGTGTKRAWARGGLVFAATILLLIGVYQFFMGLAAIVRDNFFVVGPNYYYVIDTTAYGWIHLGIGIVAVLTGLFLFTGAFLARVIAVAICVVSAVANFFFLPYYPLWAMLLIALDIFAIWAISTARVRDEVGPDYAAAGAGMATPGVGAGTYGATQTGERWPAENVPGRHTAAQDVKEGAGQTAEEAQQQAQAAAQSAGQRVPPTGQQPPQPPQGYPQQ